jgi:hypothetical protein
MYGKWKEMYNFHKTDSKAAQISADGAQGGESWETAVPFLFHGLKGG